MPSSLKVFWPHNSVAFNGKSLSVAWSESLSRFGYSIAQEPAGADIAFFISDSMLDESVIGTMPTICYFWGWLPERVTDPRFKDDYARKVALMSKCTRVLVPSYVTMYQALQLGLKNTQMCLPGIDSRTLDQFARREGERKLQIVSVGRLAEHKALEVLIQAMSLIEPRIPLVAIGPGDTTKYDQLAKQLGVPVLFLDATDEEKVHILQESMCLVCPSYYEGFSMPPLEGLYLGTPVIASDIPQHRWLLQEDAYYFSSVDGLAQVMAQISQDFVDAQKKAAAGGERVSKSFTLDLAAQRLSDHIHQTIKQHLGKRIRVEKDPDSVKQIYDTEHRRNWAYAANRFDPTWARHWRAQHFIEQLTKYKTKSVVDIGCGAVYPTIFARAGFAVTAIDISSECLEQVLEIAKKWGIDGKIKTVCSPAQSLPLADNSQDAAMLGEILEHVFDPEKVLEEAYRVVKPGGVVVASTPLGHHHFDPMHVASADGGWTEEGIRKLVATHKDEVELIKTIAEDNTDPSCFLFVLLKKKSS